MPAFRGFPPETLAFLAELEVNNTRDWFNANKDRYEACVREPALDLIATMGPHLGRISEHFLAMPKKVGGSLMRVHRDTRFAKDKTPYKTNIGIQFRHELGKDVHAPGYYVHLDTSSCFLGVGMWHPESSALAKIRTRIDEDSAGWKKAAHGKAFTGTWALGGDSLKRAPRGYPAEHPWLDDLKRKDFIATTSFDPQAAEDPAFVQHLAAQWKRATPFMRWLCAAVEVPF